MTKRLLGKTAIVVGAGTKGEDTGSGKAVAIQLAREGAAVLCVDHERTEVEETVEVIRSEGGLAETYHGDITIPQICEDIIGTCLRSFGKVDVLHNDFSIPSKINIADTAKGEWPRILNKNIKGMFMMCKRAASRMKESGGGSIINVSSVSSVLAFPDAVNCSSIGAVNSLTMNIARTYGRFNIRANVLVLGYIGVHVARPSLESEKLREINLEQIPMHRFGSPWEVATTVSFLASDDASFVTGAILPVDGGFCESHWGDLPSC